MLSDTSTPTFRLFVAIPLPESVQNEMEKAQAELRRGLPENCFRWTQRGQFHLTLKFLGNVPTDCIEALTRSTQAACSHFPAFRLRAEQIGAFPNLRSPQAIWVGVNDREGLLSKLQQAVDTAVRNVTAESGEKNFTAHVTLGRAKRTPRPPAGILEKPASEMSGRLFGEWTAAEVAIIRSELSPEGARYTTLAAVGLAAGAGSGGD